MSVSTTREERACRQLVRSGPSLVGAGGASDLTDVPAVQENPGGTRVLLNTSKYSPSELTLELLLYSDPG